MNANVSLFVICVKVIIYLLRYNLHDCNFKKTEYLKTCELKNIHSIITDD